jgi:hypothetical protein
LCTNKDTITSRLQTEKVLLATEPEMEVRGAGATPVPPLKLPPHPFGIRTSTALIQAPRLERGQSGWIIKTRRGHSHGQVKGLYGHNCEGVLISKRLGNFTGIKKCSV